MTLPSESSIRSLAERELGATFRLGPTRAGGNGWACFDAWELGTSAAVMLRVRPRSPPSDAWAGDERFDLVQRRIAELAHPHLLPSRSWGFTSQLGWLAMEWVQGSSLAELLDQVSVLDIRATIRIAEQVASVLDYAHRRRLGHGGLSPADIQVTDSGWVTVSGFAGASRVAGERIELVDQRALATIVWRCLTGAEPGAAGPGEGVAMQPRVRTVLERVLADPAELRHPTVLELVSTLGAAEPEPERLALDDAQDEPMEEEDEREDDEDELDDERRSGRRRWLMPASVAALILVAVASTLAAVRRRADPVAAPIRSVPVARPAVIAVPPQTPPPAPPEPPPLPSAASAADLAPTVAPSVTMDSIVRPAPAEVETLAPRQGQRQSSPKPTRPRGRTAADRAVADAPPGKLFVSTRPWGTLVLDGAAVAITPVAALQVRPGRHVIRITRPGFRPHEETIQVKSGEVVRLIDLILEPASP